MVRFLQKMEKNSGPISFDFNSPATYVCMYLNSAFHSMEQLRLHGLSF
jgi:hypothetical protein